MADPKKPSASNPPDEELDEEREEDEEASEDEGDEGEEEDENEDEEDDEDEDEDEDEEDDEDEDEARATTRSQRPGTTSSSEDWLPDWAPWAVLGTLLVGGLGGGLFLSLDFNPEAAPEAAASAVATTSSRPTANAKDRMRPTPSAAAQGESISASHVLIAYKGSMRADPKITRTKEEAQKRAKEVVKKAKSGSDFGALAAEYSDEPNADKRKGALGSFTRQRMVKPFADAAFQLKPGEISDVVETPFGYHVIKRTQ
jgi:parvulin-like peptidyl-prolyl isomerase